MYIALEIVSPIDIVKVMCIINKYTQTSHVWRQKEMGCVLAAQLPTHLENELGPCVDDLLVDSRFGWFTPLTSVAIGQESEMIVIKQPFN